MKAIKNLITQFHKRLQLSEFRSAKIIFNKMSFTETVSINWKIVTIYEFGLHVHADPYRLRPHFIFVNHPNDRLLFLP